MRELLNNQDVTAARTENAAIAADTTSTPPNNGVIPPERSGISLHVDIDELFSVISENYEDQEQATVDIATNDVSQIDTSAGDLNDIKIEETNPIQLNGFDNEEQNAECSVETVDQNNNEVSDQEK